MTNKTSISEAIYPENILPTLDSLLALRFQASETFHKSYKKSGATIAGNYSSPFRGRGIDFSEVRLYQPGDDVRSIDWRVTARTGKPHTKMFVEERERPVLFVLDCGSNMQFGTQGAFKSVIAAKCMAVLAWSAVQHGDRIGGLIFAGEQHEEIKPVGGKRGILRFFRQLIEWNKRQLATEELSPEVNYRDVLYRLKRIARPGSLVYFISDFSGLQQAEANLLSSVARHCNVSLIQIYDVIEKISPPAGQYQVSDGKHIGVINVDKEAFPKMIAEQFSNQSDLLESLRRKFGMHYFSIATNDNVQQVVRDKLTHKILNTF